MKCVIILLFFLLPAAVFSQEFIDKTKNEVKEELRNRSFPDGTSATISETDSSIIRVIKEPGNTSIEEMYGFDKSGKCKYERRATGCNSCYKKLLKKMLSLKKYKWKKINGNQYVSKFSEKRLIEMQTGNAVNSFTIFRIDLNKKAYKLLLAGK